MGYHPGLVATVEPKKYDVGYFMLTHTSRGQGKRSIIERSSVQNQEIERFWRDLYVRCVCIFYTLFYFLEDHMVSLTATMIFIAIVYTLYT